MGSIGRLCRVSSHVPPSPRAPDGALIRLSMVGTLLDLTNAARAASAAGNTKLADQAVLEIDARLRALPTRRLGDEGLHGRKAIDACFNLALAGANTPFLFDVLIAQAENEVRRWGRRRTCSSMTLAQLAERTAAAGTPGTTHPHSPSEREIRPHQMRENGPTNE